MHRAMPAAALGCIAAAAKSARNDAADAPPPPAYSRAALGHDALGERWPRDTAGMVGIPKRAWPERQPEIEEAPALRELLRECEAKGETCSAERFVLATALIGSKDDQAEGAALYAVDAERDADAACALGICYQRRHGRRPRRDQGPRALPRGRGDDEPRPESHYELGAMAYVGQGMDEDESRGLFALGQGGGPGPPGGRVHVGRRVSGGPRGAAR